MKVVKFTEANKAVPVKKYWANTIGAEGEYIPLAEGQRLKALLKRWNEIAPNLFDLIEEGDMGNPDTSPELTQLIQDTQEVVK